MYSSLVSVSRNMIHQRKAGKDLSGVGSPSSNPQINDTAEKKSLPLL